MAPDLAEMTPEQLEEAFWAGLESPQPPLDDLVPILDHLVDNDQSEKAFEWAELLLDALKQQACGEEIVTLLDSWARWQDTPEMRATVRDALLVALKEHRSGTAIADSIGLDKNMPLTECMDRLTKLLRFDDGVLCSDKTWGFGIVRDMDGFYRRVTIDFSGKPGHEMSFEYAAETLELIGDDHILAIKHHDEARLQNMIKSDAGEVVRITLRSYGPMNAQCLQETLENTVVPADQWKTFWAAARRDLKKDPLVDLPSKRTERIRILEKERGYDDQWVATIQASHSMPTIITMAENFIVEAAPEDLTESAKAALNDRLAFVATGARKGHANLLARAMICADALSLDVPGLDPDRLFIARALRETLEALPARTLSALLSYLGRTDTERLVNAVCISLPHMSTAPFNESTSFLMENGHEKSCHAVFEDAFRTSTPSLEMLYWLSRRLEFLADWGLGDRDRYLLLVIAQLEGTYTGARLKAVKALRSMFENRKWLKDMLHSIGDQGRRDFFRRFKDSTAWPASERTSLIARIIRLYPDLQDLMASADDSPSLATQGRFTSWRSYNERVATLEKMQTVDIPQNARDIAHARSFGDLKENHAYKAAKEHQGILLARRDKMAQELRVVKGTDFGDFPTEKSGIGTLVTIQRQDAEPEKYCVLGEWDANEERGVISSETPLAKALAGLGPGETAQVPDGQGGTTSCSVISVEELPEEVRKWASDGTGQPGSFHVDTD